MPLINRKLPMALTLLSILLAGCVSVDTATHGDHDSMTMGDMVNVLDDKTGDAFDHVFIDTMIIHHQGAVEMAEAALKYAGHEEIKQLSREIIEAQQREIDMMKQWKEEWDL